MPTKIINHVSIDLGASGGRVALGAVKDGVLDFEIIHRFPNRPIRLGKNFYWDILSIWREIREGLRLCGQKGNVSSIGVTTWGLDYVLLDHEQQLLGMVRAYRDSRTEGVYESIASQASRDEIYQATGIQFMNVNTLCQLIATKRDTPQQLNNAAHFLLLPDLLNFWLTGRIVSEHTNASTTQLYDPRRRDWSDSLINALGLPRQIFPELVEAGTVIGPLLPDIIEDIGLQEAVVVVPATHDTASAIAALPVEPDTTYGYISSGTWCLVGIETPAPIISAAGLAANVTNEQGIHGTTRLLKNETGLFILQESMRGWGEPPIEQVLAAAAKVKSDMIIDVNDPLFHLPGIDMPERIANWCQAHGMRRPEGMAETASVILRSLGKRLAQSLSLVADVGDKSVQRVHVVGGGSRIALLNQAIANESGLEVVAGPIEATTAGNILIQAEAIGVIPKGSARDVMRRSCKLEIIRPS